VKSMYWHLCCAMLIAVDFSFEVLCIYYWCQYFCQEVPDSSVEVMILLVVVFNFDVWLESVIFWGSNYPQVFVQNFVSLLLTLEYNNSIKSIKPLTLVYYKIGPQFEEESCFCCLSK